MKFALTIGDASRESGVSAKMIRYYERVGLIPPADRTSGNYRTFDDHDLHRLRFIRRARGLGFSVDQIARLLGLWQDRQRCSSDVKNLASRHLDDLNQRIAEMVSIRDVLKDLVEHCQGDQRPDCPILAEIEAG